MVAGTSTGGIIALGLAAGRTATQIRDLYIAHGGAIFPRRAVVGLLRPAFDPARLRQLLDEALGDRILGDAGVRLCIPSCEGRYGDVNVFKTPHHPDFRMDWKVPMTEVAMATSAAPTFLPVHGFGDYLYVDGGLWANNPAMVALVDALSSFDVARRRVRILSVSPGAKAAALKQRHLTWGNFFAWILNGSLMESVMHYGGLNADGQAGLLIGRDRLLRVVAGGDAAAVHMTDYNAALRHSVPAGLAAADALSTENLEAFLGCSADPPVFYHGPKAGAREPVWSR
jgi:hypothetical protein